MHALLPPPPPLPPFMLWKPTDKSGKPTMSQHSPQRVLILHVATAIFRTFLATTNGAFAPEDEMTKVIKASFLMACDEVEAPHRTLWFQLDHHYAGHVTVIACMYFHFMHHFFFVDTSFRSNKGLPSFRVKWWRMLVP